MSQEDLMQFVEEVGLQIEEFGLSRTAGRILGWLLVCDPPYQSMNDLVEHLQVSKSSISTESRFLVGVGLIERSALPGERRDYYRMVDDIWEKSFHEKITKMTIMRKLAERGLNALHNAPEAQKKRLQNMHEMYAFFEHELPHLVEKWEKMKTT